jgi:hypothetical protein
MKKLVKPIAIILLGVYSFALGQDIYPYFNDPNKQTKFEDEKVYIIEKSGKTQYYSGGENYTELANTLGYIFLDEDPDYVVVQTPLKTHYEYYYVFKIKQGTKELTELEFLVMAGYDTKAKEIYDTYEKKMRPYNIKYAAYKENLDNYYKNNKVVEHTKRVRWKFNKLSSRLGCLSLCSILTMAYFYAQGERASAYTMWGDNSGVWTDDERESFGTSGVIALGITSAFFITWYMGIDEKYTEDTMDKPSPPSYKPSIEQVLSNDQIKSLSESYNKRIYEEIKK